MGMCAAALSNLRVSETSSQLIPTQGTSPHAVSTPANITFPRKRLQYYILDVPEVTDWLVRYYAEDAAHFYATTLSENSGEVWLHRGFASPVLMDETEVRTLDARSADIVLIPAYLHLLRELRRKVSKKALDAHLSSYLEPTQLAELLASRVSALGQTKKPHVLLVPTTNPATSLSIGISKIVAAMQQRNVNLYSLGYERNAFWQRLSPERILPIPYVVSLHEEDDSQSPPLSPDVRSTKLFYAGDARPKAMKWSGCNRSMVLPLVGSSSQAYNPSDIDVTLTLKKSDKRLSFEEYNRRMSHSRFCLILCGDTPTSRSLTSSVVHGCIPLRVGSRLRGFCDPPVCHTGWGWTITNSPLSHLPYERQLNWKELPEVDEADFAADPIGVVTHFLTAASDRITADWNTLITRHRDAFVYGWGSPVNSTRFGGAVPAIWAELQRFLFDGAR